MEEAIADGFDAGVAWKIYRFAYRLGRSERAERAAVAELHRNRPPECRMFGGPCIGWDACRSHPPQCGGEAN